MKFEHTLNKIIQSNFLIQKPNKAYYSEAGIQCKIAIEIYKQLRVEPVLEYKMKGKKKYLDIFCKYRKTRFGIELKYKTSRVKSEKFDYISQGAQNNGKYDFLRDIARIESFFHYQAIDIGYVIFITNDKRYYNPARNNTLVKKFDLMNTLRKSYKPTWKGRKKNIKLKEKHSIAWLPNQKFNKNKNAVFFNYCMVKVNKQV